MQSHKNIAQVIPAADAGGTFLKPALYEANGKVVLPAEVPTCTGSIDKFSFMDMRHADKIAAAIVVSEDGGELKEKVSRSYDDTEKQLKKMLSETVLVMDIGGTFIKSAVFRNGNLICKLPQIPSCSNGTREEIINAVRSAVSQAGKVSRIAVSIPGPFDFVNGIFLMEHKFAAVKGCSFAEIVGDIPTCFIHDANAFLLGEQLHGAGRGFLRVGGITLGTGLGAAFSIGGDLQCSKSGSPAEFVKLWNKPYRDGIAEDYVSARSLLKDFPDIDAKMLEEAAVNGDIKAKQAWQEYSTALYQLLKKWKEFLNTDVIVIGGQLRKGLFLGDAVPSELNLRFSELGEDAALWGAYEFLRGRSLPLQPTAEQLRRAIISTGNTFKCQQFFKRAEQGENLTIGVLGGSITSGARCSEPEKRYHGVMIEYLKQKYPSANFTLVNAGVGATDSVFGAFRAKKQLLSHSPDLVILEFAVNDKDDSLHANSYEGVVRQILASNCALILLFMTHNHLQNGQRFQEVIGRYYDLPMVSFRDALMPELLNGSLRWDDLSIDEVHPNTEAHSFAGQLICGLLEKISKQPPDKEMPMSEPMISDEFEHTFMLRDDNFEVEQQNWTKVPEDDPRGKQYQGCWFASEPGSSLQFSFSGSSLYISCLGIDGAAGRISVKVDQLPEVMIDSYFPHDWEGAKQFWHPVAHALENTEHQVVITLQEEHDPAGGTEFYLRAAGGCCKDKKI